MSMKGINEKKHAICVIMCKESTLQNSTLLQESHFFAVS